MGSGAVYPLLVVVLLALAGCTLLVARRANGVSEEALGFAYVGAAGLTLLATAVAMVGVLSGEPGRAEGLALMGLGAYVVYLLAAWAVIRLLRRPR